MTTIKRFLTLFLIATFSISAWGDSYTITFKTGTGDGSAASTSTSVSAVISSGGDYVSGLASASRTYYAGGSGLKLGASSNPGSFELTLSDDGKVTADSILVNAKLYNASKAATINVNSGTAQSVTSSFADYKFVIGSDIENITLASSKYLWVSSVTVYYTPTTTYTITPATSDGDMGTVSLTGSVITASPKSGYQVKESEPYTVTAGTATVTRGTGANVNKFTVAPTSDCTVRINFEAIPTYAIRFFNNGTQVGSTQNLPAGATAVKPSDPAACDEGYTFVGWWTDELDEDNTTAYTWVTDFTVSGAQDYYAVFSHSDGSGSKYSKTPSSSSDLVSSAGGTVYTITIATGVTVTISGWTSNPPIYHSDGQWRIYGGSSVVIASSGDNISKIEFTSTQNYLSTTEGTYSAQTWTGDASSVTFTNGATQSRITGISVTIGEAGTTYYTTDCGSTCYTPTLSFGITEVTKFVGDANFTYTATPDNNPLGGTVSYTSNKPTKASVDPSTGEVTILDAMSNEPIIITATLDKVTSSTECQKKVTASYTLNIYNRVTWSVNGAPYTAGNPTQQTVEGGTITDYPTPNPDGSSVCGGKTFAGWTDAPISVPQATAPATLYTSLESMSSVHITENKTFYAVFVDQSGDPDVYRKGTLSDLTHGQTTVIVNPAASKAMSNTGSDGSLNATAVSFNGSGKIENPSASLRWHVEKNAAQYKFKNGYYVYAYSTSSIYCDEDDATYTDYWTITASGSNYVMYSNRSSSSKYLQCYNSKFQLYNAGTSGYFLMDFYVPDVSYADYTTTCGPTIKANEVEHLTSYKDQTVRSDSIVVRGSSLTADGTLIPSITGTDAGLFECTLASNAISAAGAIESKFVIRYTPTAFGDAQHTATLTFSDGTTTSDPITLNGRSLPEEFAMVAYDGAQYYVLDGTMTGSAALVMALPVTIETGAVKLCPTQAVYSLTERATPDQYVHLVGPTGRRLYGEGSKTGLNTHTAGSTDGTGWLLATSDFNTYHITNATTTNRGIMLSNGTKTVFGHYKTSNYGTSGYYGDIQLLPITAKCTCLPKPAVTCVAKATKATLSWEAVEGATEYEITCSGGTVTSPVTGLTATITGLTESTNYTYSVKAIATGTDCSLYHNGAFTTTNCDDVPYDIFTTPGVHSVTVKWKMEAANATIRIYTDEECNTQFGSDHTGLTSPATIEGLNENTTYYFKIWADNYCVSATETFITNSTSVEIVEWFTDSIRIIIDAGADASVIIEDKKEHGSETGNVADKLFISKYFEADGNNKMVAIYNGTVDTIDITDMWFKHSNKGTSETKFCLKNFGKKPGKIAPNEEIIIMRYSSDTDPAKTCAEKEDNYDEWNIIRDGDTDGKGNDIYAWLCFSGPQSIGLYDGSTNKFIDVIGATTNNSGTGSLVQILASNSTHCSYTEKSANDGSGFYADGKEVETGNDILLSTNRCLLIRKNTVKSGDDAIANNVYTPQEDCSAEIGESFTTLGSEWMGFVIGKGAGAATKTCEGLAYVGGFDYQGYYTTYDSISGLKDLTGNQNPDGTYTIPIDSLDTLACTMMRIKVYEGGVEKASREYKIPIMVEGNKTTKDTIFINDNPNQLRTYNTCKECDVLILKGATLTKASHSELKDQDTINNLTIYPGGTFIVPEGDNYKYAVNSIHFRVQGEETPIVKLKGKVTTHDGQITVSRRITNDRYYFFSLPYDCNVSDIRWSNGEVPTRGADYEIIEYDAVARAAQGSTKGAPGHWKPAGSTLHAGVGYCVAVSSAYIKELMFPMSIGGTDEDLTNKEDTKTTNKVSLEQHSDPSSSKNNWNWNLIAHPYVSPFDAYENDIIKAGWLECISPKTDTEDAVWEYTDAAHVYLTMPSFGASKTTYTQTVSSSITTLNPFLAVFVQAVSAGDLTFDKNHRQLNAAPARHLAAKAENEDESIFVGVTLSGNGQSDQTNVRIRPDFTDDYQLGYDLQKFTTFYTSRPQIYMKPADLQLAFQAVNDDKAKNTWMPMGVYCYEPGTFTFTMSEDYPIDEVEAVYLYDKTTGTTTNLLYDTYTITTSKQLYSNTRFSLNVIVNRRVPEVTTDIDVTKAPNGVVRKLLINGHVYIQRGEDIYDVTGKQLLNR